ncbi:hypothetical protein OIV83_000322 [Microbotryomycetes sp. JL201]|nr:hypothetical protein OIV83_000322 [Microbotryomycetes sp. JL201]
MPFNKYQPWGLVSSEALYGAAQSCQLTAVRVCAHVHDLSATVKLTQHYTSTAEASENYKYLFPVPDRAVVTSFEMLKQDGTRIVGIVQERKQAQITYDEAVKQGKLASLATEQTPDTFSLQIGNLMAKEQVTIELTYATELTEDESNDTIKLHIPAYVGDRYGNLPDSYSSASNMVSAGAFTKFELDASFEMLSAIRQISSPSHPVTTSLGPDPALANTNNLPTANLARVQFATSSTLDKDIVIAVKATGLDSPRCTIERHAKDGTAALRLTLVPKFNLPPIPEQAYMFVVDRSGSMGGERIDMARKALIVMLRSLPARGTSFNIVSFGSKVDSLWRKSKVYDQDSLAQATSHVDAMDADYGGTETRQALDYAFGRRDAAVPTSAWDLENVFETVSRAVKQSEQLLRVFVLGIGDSASTAMCQGIARHGKGTTQFVVDGENFTGKTARLLKAAKSPSFENVELELPGVAISTSQAEDDDTFVILDKPNESTKPPAAPKSLFDEAVDPIETTETDLLAEDTDSTYLPDPPLIQQAPHKIDSLYSGTRLNAYVLLQKLAIASGLPQKVILKAHLNKASEPLLLEVPVQVPTSPEIAQGFAGSYPLHSLAARKLVQDLSDGRHNLTVTLPRTSFQSEAVKQKALDKVVKAHIVRLGITYGIASKETSFVAVDETESADARPKRKVYVVHQVQPPPAGAPVAFGGWGGGGGAAPRARMFRAAAPSAAISPPPAAVAPAPALFSTSAAVPMASMAPYGAAPAVAFGSSTTPSFGADKLSQGQLLGGGGAPLFKGVQSEFRAFGTTSVPTNLPSESVQPDSARDVVTDLARRQRFDGSFELDVVTLVSKFTSLTLSDDPNKLEESWLADAGDERRAEASVLVTALVLVLWDERASDRRDEWEAMAEKGWEYIEGQTQDAKEALKKWALKMIAKL